MRTETVQGPDGAADRARASVVVEPVADGYRLSRDACTETLDADALASRVAELEGEAPRWVWDTARVYPALLRRGVRVARAWDVRLARAILRRAAGVGQAYRDLPADGWDEPSVPDADDLLPIDVTPELDASEEWSAQRAAVADSERAGALRLLVSAESAGALAAAEMHAAGVPWRREVHERVLADLLGDRTPPGARPAQMERLAGLVRGALAAPSLNPDSAVELMRALRTAGLPVETTRARELQRLDHPVVEPLLAYKDLARLHSANGWHWLDTWVADGRFRPEYVVGGVVTGRWATRGGGALQLPKRIRSAVVADDGWTLVVADAAQLEPRVLAGMAHDRSMTEAGRGRDLYDGIVASGAVATRAAAKIAMLAALYGATSGEAGRLVPRLANRFPRALRLVEDAARQGERGGDVHTLLGRGSPPPSGAQRDLDRRAADLDADEALLRRVRGLARDRGRFTRNFVVQGTAAEWALCWIAELRRRLWGLGGGLRGPHLVYFLHDELIVHSPAGLADAVAGELRAAAEAAGRLLFGDFPVDFPLDVSIVDRYSDAA